MKTIPVQHPFKPSVLVSSLRFPRRQVSSDKPAGSRAFPVRGMLNTKGKKTFFALLRKPLWVPVGIKRPKSPARTVFSKNGVNFGKRKH
jgi:hypothetical protein